MSVMAKRCYYETLGVQRTANDAEIKGAFRKLAMQLHPDRNPGDKDSEHKFKEANEAYDVLKDAQKRAAYDRFGHAAFEQGGGGHGFGSDFASSFADIFDDLFGMGGRRGGARGQGRERGADLRYNM
jgi:molecular chaperone DnaJ